MIEVVDFICQLYFREIAKIRTPTQTRIPCILTQAADVGILETVVE